MFTALTSICITLVCLGRVNATPFRRSMFPVGEPSPAWQAYHEVTQPLPNVSFSIGHSYAGNIPLLRGTNLSLFYWAFESKKGSLTSSTNEAPWQIWLNGGPGSSSLIGLFIENGPIRLQADYSAAENKFSWDRLADTFWVDQPVGVGYSTLEADGSGQVVDENDVGRDFWQFVTNLVKVYPHLARRPLHIMGESYAGMYIPYMVKHYFGMTNPPTKLAKMAIGDGTIANNQVFSELPLIYVLETFPQMISYDVQVFQWFKEQNHLCGYDLNLTYPQQGKFPTINLIPGSRPYLSLARLGKRDLLSDLEKRYQTMRQQGQFKRDQDREEARRAWKRDLSLRSNGTIDSWYGCDIYSAAVDYIMNFTYPWNAGGGFNPYDAQSALNPMMFLDASVFLNDNRTRNAIHAPQKEWQLSTFLSFSGNGADLSPEPMVFLDDLATNATAQNVSIIIYSGNDDTLVPHRGSEVTIQNTTFGGIQGFTQRPSTPWYNDDGSFAGIVHQERGWTYVLFEGASHLVPNLKPAAAYTFVREFVLGNNKTGLVTSPHGSAIGGEDPKLAADVLTEGPEIYVGQTVTQSTYEYPPATVANFNSFLATLTVTPGPQQSC